MEKRITFKPDISRGLECLVDTNFAGACFYGGQERPESVLSRTEFVIMYAGCPTNWSSKLQMGIALSPMKAEYIDLSQSMCGILPFLHLLKEICEVFPFQTSIPGI